MDAPHLGSVVVQKRNNPIFELSVDLDLLVNFALNARAIGLLIQGEERFVSLVHVTADSDGAFRNKPLLACFFPANVVEDLLLKREQRIRNDLFVSGIILSL